MNRIVHLGTGNFHRAHQAWYTQTADPDWRITGVSLRSAAVRDALAPQGFAYTLVVRDADGDSAHRIDVIDELLVAPEDPGAVVTALADPAVAVVTLTVTEKGHHLDADGRLALGSAAIAADVDALRGAHGSPGASPPAPSTAVGFLVAALARRAAHGVPLTVLCCDNLPENGATLGAAVRALADAAGLDAAAFAPPAVRFPSSMVDRITPATDDGLRERVAASGLPPAAPVETETFTEWVIEDRFAGPRPRWERAGAAFVDDVRPFERRKLRLLNGAHSLLAYAGTLAGHAFVHEAIADPALATRTVALMAEAASTLSPTLHDGADAYAEALLERFANPALAHRLRQIAMDGSLKLPIRVLETRAARAADGLESPACDAALAAWRAFLVAELEAGRDLDDPAAERLREGIARGEDALTLLAP